MMKKFFVTIGLAKCLVITCSEGANLFQVLYSASTAASNNQVRRNVKIIDLDSRIDAYLHRVHYYQTEVFKRPLTPQEKNLYCGHLLER